MMNITNNQNKTTVEIDFLEHINIQIINHTYLTITLKEGKLRIYSNQLCCDFCGTAMNKSSFNYKGFLFCENCLNDIKMDKIGVVS